MFIENSLSAPGAICTYYTYQLFPKLTYMFHHYQSMCVYFIGSTSPGQTLHVVPLSTP